MPPATAWLWSAGWREPRRGPGSPGPGSCRGRRRGGTGAAAPAGWRTRPAPPAAAAAPSPAPPGGPPSACSGGPPPAEREGRRGTPPDTGPPAACKWAGGRARDQRCLSRPLGQWFPSSHRGQLGVKESSGLWLSQSEPQPEAEPQPSPSAVHLFQGLYAWGHAAATQVASPFSSGLFCRHRSVAKIVPAGLP